MTDRFNDMPACGKSDPHKPHLFSLPPPRLDVEPRFLRGWGQEPVRCEGVKPFDLDIDTIEARANAATPGPWIVSQDESLVISEMVCDLVSESTGDTIFFMGADQAFAAAARTDVPALVAEIRRLRSEVASLKERLVIDNAAIDRGVEAFYNQERTKLGWYHAPDERSAMRAALDAARRSPAACQACSAPLNPEQIVIATSRGSEAKYCSIRCRQTARTRRRRAQKTHTES